MLAGDTIVGAGIAGTIGLQPNLHRHFKFISAMKPIRVS